MHDKSYRNISAYIYFKVPVSQSTLIRFVCVAFVLLIILEPDDNHDACVLVQHEQHQKIDEVCL
jgi:hypothetical protein